MPHAAIHGVRLAGVRSRIGDSDVVVSRKLAPRAVRRERDGGDESNGAPTGHTAVY